MRPAIFHAAAAGSGSDDNLTSLVELRGYNNSDFVPAPVCLLHEWGIHPVYEDNKLAQQQIPCTPHNPSVVFGWTHGMDITMNVDPVNDVSQEFNSLFSSLGEKSGSLSVDYCKD